MAYSANASSEVAEGAGVEPASPESESGVPAVIPTLNVQWPFCAWRVNASRGIVGIFKSPVITEK